MVKEKILAKKRTTTVAIAGSQVKSVRFVSTEKTGFRVIDGGKIGIFGATGTVDECDAWKRAEQNLANDIPYPVQPESNVVKSVDNTPALLGDKQFVDEVERFLACLRKECPKFIFSNCIKKVEIERTLTNDQGVDLAFKTGYYIVSPVIKEESSANVFDLGYAYAGREFNTEQMVAEVKEMYDAYYNVVDIEPGERLVIGSPSDFGFMKLYRDVMADPYCTGTSLLAGKAGQKLFNEKVSIFENREFDNYSTTFFDDEGVMPAGGRNYIVKDGVFVGPIACKRDQAKYGLERAGSASSSYDGVPGTSMDGLTFASCGKTVKELTSTEDAIYLVMAAGGDTTPDGNFATPVQASFLVRDGKLVGRLPALNIAGNIFDTFGKNFVGRAEDGLSVCDGDDNKPMVARMTVSK